MNPGLLLKHFDRISDAPDAVPRLRRFILDLAIRGRLVAQDPNDEPATELLKRIQAQKLQLVKEKILKRQGQTTVVDEQAPFTMPRGWTSTTLGDVAHKITDGAHKTPTYVSKGIPFISVKDFSAGKLDFSHTRLIPPEEHAILYKRCDPRRGDILIGRIGTLGKAVLVDTDKEFSLFVSVGLIRFSQDFIAPDFLRLFLNSPVAEAEYERIKVGGGTHTNKLNLGDLHSVFLPLPPLTEQRRIVAKVNELRALCDRLEECRRELETQRERVASSALHHLSNGASPDSLKRSSRFYLDHLGDLTARPSQIPELRRTILSLAVRGRLVSQDRNEEPASELVKRIEAEKSRRIEANAIRRERPLAPITREDEPFTIPENWTWVRIGTCALLTDYGTSVKSDELEDGVPVLAMGDIQDGQVILRARKKVPREIDELPNLFLKHFDLLYNRTNSAELVGKTGIYLGEDDAFTFASYLIRIRFLKELTSPVYVNLAMNAPYFRETQIIPELRQQCGQANVNGTKLRNMMIPLPPVGEQRRIVARVEQLMTLCTQVESQLSATLIQKDTLLQAVLHHALN